MARWIKFLGDGEWQARKHGVQGRRQWRKVHLAMDTATSAIGAVEFIPGTDGDSPVLPELLGQIPEGEEIGTVTADGACDCPAAIARNETLRAIRHYGRAFWKRWTGYHVRSLIEAKMPSQVRSNLWRSTCSTSRPSVNASPQETRTARPPKSR